MIFLKKFKQISRGTEDFKQIKKGVVEAVLIQKLSRTNFIVRKIS